MSLEVLTAIWSNPPCKGGELLCLLAIADNADGDGLAWPSIKTIAKKAAMSERGAQKCVKKLADAGLIFIEQGGGRNKTNAYWITTNGIGSKQNHKNPEQNTVNHGSPFEPEKGEQCDIKGEQSDAKPRTPVHPNHQEPPITTKSSSSSAREEKTELSIDALYAEVLAAVGHRNGHLPTHWMPPAAQMHVNRWRADLGLTDTQIIHAARESRKRHDEPPNGPKALDRVMANVAAQLTAPKLKPTVGPQVKGPRKHFEVMAERMAKTGTDGR